MEIPIDLLGQGLHDPPDTEDKCMVCQEQLAGNGDVHTLECGHKFHTVCIMAWFRHGQGACPYCRDTGVSARASRSDQGQRRYSRYGVGPLTNFKSIIAYSRRRDAPPPLVGMVKTLRSMEAELAERKEKLDSFRKSKHPDQTFSELRREHWKLNRSCWGQYRKVGEQKKRIDSYPVIPLIVPKFVRVTPSYHL